MPEERRVVTLLFADVAGSTALGETTDPEELRAILGRYYAIAKEVIAAHGGTIEKFIGDAVMAIFGHPQAHGDDAERALAAALLLRGSVASDPATASLILRIGVNTGEVVASRDPGGADFLVTGDAVNVAARLQQHATPGTILVGARTHAATKTAFAFSAERDLSVKGKSTPLHASELVGRLAQRTPLRRAPFIGRDADVARLELVAKRAFEDRRPQVVTITGPAGTGKSRLIEELIARLGPGPLIATAQCLPYGASVTYLPLRELARVLLGPGADTSVQQRSADALRAGGCPDADAERIGALIAATVGEREIEERDRDQLFGAWRLFIETLAPSGPLIIVFEDLHWASDRLVDLIEQMTRPRTRAPLLMVALARPEFLERRPEWGGGRRSSTLIELDPLSRDETRRLVDGLADRLPANVASGIANRAGGNPFFAGELARAYEDLRLAGASVADVVLPDTVHATVLARIDALPEPARTILQYGSIAGRTVTASAVAALVPFDRADIETALRGLADRQFLTITLEGCVFTHELIREVAYASLSRADRVRAHVALAGWLEAEAVRQRTQLTELIAYHYRQAVSLTPGARLPAGLELGRVVSALERAARLASNGGAVEEAGAQLREAIRLSPPEDLERLYELLGDTVHVGDEAAAGYTEALARWRMRDASSRDPRVGARLLIRLALVYGRLGGQVRKLPTSAGMDAILAEAAPLVAASGDPALAAGLACAQAFRGSAWVATAQDLRRLERDVADAARFFGTLADRRSESEALDALANVCRESDQWERAVDATRSRLGHVDELDLFERSDASGVLVMDLVHLGKFDEALTAHAEATRELRVGESELALGHTTAWAAVAADLSGRWDRCTSLSDSLLQAWQDSHRSAMVGRSAVRGFVAGLNVAIGRADATRATQFRGAILAVAGLADLPADHWYRAYVSAVVDRRPADLTAAIDVIRHADAEALAGAIAIAVFEADMTLDNRTLDHISTLYSRMPPALEHRIALVRALHAGAESFRTAIASADSAGMASDVARALALVGIRTGDAAMIRGARGRLERLNDRLYLARLPTS